MAVAFEGAGDSSFGNLVFAVAIPARIRLASAPFALVAVKTVDARTSHFQAALDAFSAIFAVANDRLRAFADLDDFAVATLESIGSERFLAATTSFIGSERKSFWVIPTASIRLVL